MADYIVKDTELTSVANSIRTAGSTSSLLTFPNGFISAINNISGGGGSSDFSTATVTVTGEMSLPPKVLHPTVATLSEDGDASMGIADWIIGETFNVILYKGKAWLYEDSGNLTIPSGETNITYDSSEEAFLITGDCTITIS